MQISLWRLLCCFFFFSIPKLFILKRAQQNDTHLEERMHWLRPSLNAFPKTCSLPHEIHLHSNDLVPLVPVHLDVK